MRKIIGILVCTVVFALLAGCMEQSNVSPGGIPLYSGSKSYSAPANYYQIINLPTQGVQIKTYYVENADASEIINWYKSHMNGWEMDEEIPVTSVSTPQGEFEWGAVLFKKGDEGAGIWAMSGIAVESGKGAIYYVVTGPYDKLKGIEGLPSSDQVQGEEPFDRYPGSVMLDYYKDDKYPYIEGVLTINYGTKDNYLDVINWYRDYFLDNGWEIGDNYTGSDKAYYEFINGSKVFQVNVFPPSESTSYTEIRIDYYPNEIPPNDLVSGEEPIERYPGSVMTKYNTYHLIGEQIEITYVCSDDPETVKNWYQQELNNEGWTVLEISAMETGYTISALKGDLEGGTTLTITISNANYYTEIAISYASIS